jgi:hypothetical protein
LLVDFFATLDIFRGVPASDAFTSESVIEALSEFLILVGVADRDGIELDRFMEEGGEVIDHHIRETTAS